MHVNACHARHSGSAGYKLHTHLSIVHGGWGSQAWRGSKGELPEAISTDHEGQRLNCSRSPGLPAADNTRSPSGHDLFPFSLPLPL